MWIGAPQERKNYMQPSLWQIDERRRNFEHCRAFARWVALGSVNVGMSNLLTEWKAVALHAVSPTSLLLVNIARLHGENGASVKAEPPSDSREVHLTGKRTAVVQHGGREHR